MAFWNRKTRQVIPQTHESMRHSVTYNGHTYPLSHGYSGIVPDLTSLSAGRPRLSGDLASIVATAQPHSVMSAAVLVRALLVSELRFRWADLDTHEMFGNRDLAPLENPGGATMTRPRMLMQLSQQADYTGNGIVYFDERRGRLRVLRADHMTQVLASDANPQDVAEVQKLPAGERKEALEWVLDADVAGWLYKPHRSVRAQFIEPQYVMHWAPEPHPLTPFWGASWISSAVTELQADVQIDRGIDAFFEHGMTPRLMHIMGDDMSPEEALEWKLLTEDEHAGIMRGSKNLYAGGVKDIRVVGTTLKDLGLEAHRGMLETRIAVRSRIPAPILGIAEGNKGSALNASTYGSSRRMMADGFFTPHAAGLCAAFEQIIAPPAPTKKHPAGGYLTYDPTQISFLQEDEKDRADIFGVQASSVRALTDGGYEPESAIAAVHAADVRKLVHTGKVSVQLFEPGATNEKVTAA